MLRCPAGAARQRVLEVFGDVSDRLEFVGHGSAPKYAGLDKANPTALILSAALMLRHLGHPDHATRVETAIREVIAEGRTVTYDLGGWSRGMRRDVVGRTLKVAQ